MKSPIASTSAPKWYEKYGVIYLTLPPTDGTTGPQWIERLNKQGYESELGRLAEKALCSKDFWPTSGVVYQVAILPGKLFEYENRTIERMQFAGINRRLITPNPEVACLTRKFLEDADIKAMGLVRIVTMHKSIDVSDSNGPGLFVASRHPLESCLDLCPFDDPGLDRWYRTSGFYRDCGFEFIVSRSSSAF